MGFYHFYLHRPVLKYSTYSLFGISGMVKSSTTLSSSDGMVRAQIDDHVKQRRVLDLTLYDVDSTRLVIKNGEHRNGE